jgi:hypothetical protein
MAKAKTALAPLTSNHAQAEREKASKPSTGRSKSGDDEWALTPPMKQALQESALPKSDDVLAEIAKQEGIDQAPPELTARIWETARELYRRQTEVARLTARIKMETEEITRLSENVLPEMMSEAQTKEMTSTTGVKLVKADKVYGNISKENEPAAHAWLEANKFGSIIKFGFSIPVEKGDVKLAKMVRALLKKAKLAFEEKSSVHYQTLQAFIRESVEQARKLPSSITYVTKPVVEIKLPKAKKTKASVTDSTSNDIDL